MISLQSTQPTTLRLEWKIKQAYTNKRNPKTLYASSLHEPVQHFNIFIRQLKSVLGYRYQKAIKLSVFINSETLS